MRQGKRTIVAVTAGTALMLGVMVSAQQQGQEEPVEQQSPAAQAPAAESDQAMPGQRMMRRGRRMMHEGMQEQMQQARQQLEQKLEAMREAEGEAKVEAIAEVVEELSSQHLMMMQRHERMMEGRDQDMMGPGMMGPERGRGPGMMRGRRQQQEQENPADQQGP